MTQVRPSMAGRSPPPKPGTTGEAIKQAGLAAYATPYPEHAGKLMHNKFLIRDDTDVWTGSANFTTGGLRLQHPNGPSPAPV
jgi:phosphatidylserine/phosphatidylglycerophosphate/cardiolipin synthase-like enzyme